MSNDNSAKQQGLAKERCPQANFVRGNTIGVEFESGSLGAVVDLYMVYQPPVEDQKSIMCEIQGYLRFGGWTVCNGVSVLSASLGIEETLGKTKYESLKS